MDRPIIYPQEQARTFDLLNGYVQQLISIGALWNDLSAGITTALGGWAPTYNGNLTVTLGSGRLYQVEDIDTTAYSSLSANTTQVVQQAINPGQTLTFTTAGLTSGQSQWVLVEVIYAQADTIPSNDPTGGVLTYANPASPTEPYIGPNNAGTSQPTLRQAQAVLQLKYGTPATTGSQVPPSVDAGYQPMYLVNLTYGQTSITSADLFIAGPTVTPNPPAYTAPFYTGPAGASTVTSVFGRTGAVVANTGDYTAAEVTDAADVTAANTFTGTNTFKNANQTFEATQSGSAAASPLVVIKAWTGSAGIAVNVYVDASGIIHFRNSANSADLMTLDQSGNAVFAGQVTATSFNN
jgi:hypothetical protein